jgi:hypothetical protein
MLSKQTVMIVVLIPRAFCLRAGAFIHRPLTRHKEKVFYFPFLVCLRFGRSGLGALVWEVCTVGSVSTSATQTSSIVLPTGSVIILK